MWYFTNAKLKIFEMTPKTRYVQSPVVSVVIPCYNHGRYLPVAIESVLNQTYSHVEIIVVDDGSTDNTKEVAHRYEDVIYIWQKNRGLSASRNTGIKNATGKYVTFLDADDWLYPNALVNNLKYLQQDDRIAFVSGAYDEVLELKNYVDECRNKISSNHYKELLHANYIGMISTVLFHSWVLEEFLFDETLKACEDYDLFLKITRKYPVLHHTEKIAAYRKHGTNMSLDFSIMLSSALKALEHQKPNLQTAIEFGNYKEGRRHWKNYYAQKVYERARNAKTGFAYSDLFFLLKNRPYLFFRFIIVHPIRKMIGNKIQFRRLANQIRS